MTWVSGSFWRQMELWFSNNYFETGLKLNHSYILQTEAMNIFLEINPAFHFKQISHFNLLVKSVMFANCECFYFSSSLIAHRDHFCKQSASILLLFPILGLFQHPKPICRMEKSSLLCDTIRIKNDVEIQVSLGVWYLIERDVLVCRAQLTVIAENSALEPQLLNHRAAPWGQLSFHFSLLSVLQTVVLGGWKPFIISWSVLSEGGFCVCVCVLSTKILLLLPKRYLLNAYRQHFCPFRHDFCFLFLLKPSSSDLERFSFSSVFILVYTFLHLFISIKHSWMSIVQKWPVLYIQFQTRFH